MSSFKSLLRVRHSLQASQHLPPEKKNAFDGGKYAINMVIRAFNNCSKITDYVAWAEKIGGRATWRARRGGSWCSASRRRCKAQTRPVAMKHKRFVKSCFCIILSQWLLVHRRSYWRRQHITQQLPTGLLCRPTLLFQKKAAETCTLRLPYGNPPILLFTGGRGRGNPCGCPHQ